MRDAEPSRTAMMTAFVRAVHVHADDAPPVFDDHQALALLPDYQRRFIGRLGALPRQWRNRYRIRRSGFTSMRAHVIVRARYAEDALMRAREAGAARYVVLAAGLDTFALRQSRPTVAVVEIDHPATQRWKRELLASRGITTPDELTFLPLDFERESLDDVWIEADAADFVSWLGVTYYLSRDAIVATLETLAARCRQGSQLVLDYWRAPPAWDASTPLMWGTRIAVAMQQEPMRSFFDPEEIETLAVSAGWTIRENCPPDEQDRRYLAGRSDRLAVPSFAHLLHLER